MNDNEYTNRFNIPTWAEQKRTMRRRKLEATFYHLRWAFLMHVNKNRFAAGASPNSKAAHRIRLELRELRD